jgi:hypothetical protein
MQHLCRDHRGKVVAEGEEAGITIIMQGVVAVVAEAVAVAEVLKTMLML